MSPLDDHGALDPLYWSVPPGPSVAKARRAKLLALDEFLTGLDSPDGEPARESEMPTVRDFVQNTDQSQRARQERLDAIPPAQTNPNRGGTEMPDINRQWGSKHLERFYFAQDNIWITANGDAVKIAEMDPTHALNSLLMLERMSGQLAIKGTLQEQALYKALYSHVCDALPEEEVPVEPLVDRAYTKGTPRFVWTTPEGIKRALQNAKETPGNVSKTVRIDYRASDGTLSTGRRIKVLDVYTSTTGIEYLLGYDFDREGVRSFTLSGVLRVERDN